MKLLRWLERKLFTGEVIRDYGPLGELTGITSPGEVSLLLCKRRGQLQLVVRTHTHFDLNWYPVRASAALAAKLAEVAEDIRTLVETEALDETPQSSLQEKSTAIRERPSHGS
jgi:hypothetical protein